ncbi:4-hydroxybenzoate transporter [Sporolactobacillus inulinus]|uniref:4-hydroxybenzoate transporter n=1 Tax=Sporolactobacillus inulinus TaxID=2078 RepID=A0A4Y1Z7K3_9BACL|nr:hypothetical protein [Sporolactobacillus inulinus]GAY74928.1 4-hydroxybenzoate transporter [Sporolactobacillus inulinus]
MTMPLYILLFIFPIDQLSLPNTTNSVILFFSLLGDLVTNPWILTLFIISLFASAAQSANTPNWLALITDVNLPEHRGAVFSIANLFNSFGRTVGNLGDWGRFGNFIDVSRQPKRLHCDDDDSAAAADPIRAMLCDYGEV